MEIFDSINLYLMSHPAMLEQLALLFRIKFWLLLGLAFWFLYLASRETINKRSQPEPADGKAYLLA